MRREKRKFSSRLLAGTLAAIMAFSVLPAQSAKAAVTEAARGETVTTKENGVVLNKTATLENDGTYTIELEAWAEGQVVEQTMALDIVMAIDHSGSMLYTTADKYNGSEVEYHADRINENMSNEEGKQIRTHAISQGYYTHAQKEGSNMTGWNNLSSYSVLQYHPKYVNGDFEIYQGQWSKSTISGSDAVLGTRVMQPRNNISNVGYIYKTRLGSTIDAANSFFEKVKKNAADKKVNHRVAIAGFSNNKDHKYKGSGVYIGFDFYNYGSSEIDAQYGKALQDVSTAKGAQNVYNSIFLPGAARELALQTYTGIGLNVAEKIFDNSPSDIPRKKIVVLLADGEFNGTESNIYSAANALKKKGVEIYSICASDDVTTDYLNKASSNYDTNGNKVSNNYYFFANDSEGLTKVFEDISKNITQTTVTLDETSILKDVMGDGFKLTEDTVVSTSTATYKGNNNWNTAVNTSFNVTKDVANNQVSVSGFDYAENYVANQISGQAARGKKLIVKITGVQATDNAVKNQVIYTNDTSLSGLYYADAPNAPAIVFGSPRTAITSQSYVLDYAKPLSVASSDWYQNSLLAFTEVDDNGLIQASTSKAEIVGNYGKLSADGNTAKYTPTTTNWKGADSFYTVGTWEADKKLSSISTGNNVLTKLDFVPANSIYYEDDFESNTSEGVVGIEYSGTWDTNSDGATSTNDHADNVGTGNPNGNDAVHGWEDVLADDTKYSDGSAHKAEADKGNASAKFTFTGTGVDIYSRTNLSTGTVFAYLKGKTDNGTAVNKALVVDQLAESGDYYQIPTLWFHGLEHGEYTVELMVTTTAQGRYTYYLDGIRVYNPLGTTDEMYSENEQDATFIGLRNILLDESNIQDGVMQSGAVFIDTLKEGQESGDDVAGTPTTTVQVATYKKYGPKNEVYLGPGQAIVFRVNEAPNYYIGLKSPTGEAAKATVSSGENSSGEQQTSVININHSTDMYYKVQPNADGDGKYIMIQNTGTELLSVTKLRTAGNATNGAAIMSASLDELTSYATTFMTLKSVSYEETLEPADSKPSIEIKNPFNIDNVVNSIIKKLLGRLFTGFEDWF